MTPPRRRRPSELLAPGEYEDLLYRQRGVCAICLRPPKEGGRRLDVDHDHRTGEIRGLLCHTCNHFLLGKYATAEKLRRAADYLDNGGGPITVASSIPSPGGRRILPDGRWA